MDTLYIDSIELWTHIGVPEEERRTEQRVLVSLEMTADLSAAGKSDDVKDSINYADVVASVRILAKAKRKTIENLAGDIAAMILEEYMPDTVKVSVWKHPPLPGVRAVCATVIRSRTKPAQHLHKKRLYA